MTRIVIMGGGPAGYEAALVAAQHGADVTIVERDGLAELRGADRRDVPPGAGTEHQHVEVSHATTLLRMQGSADHRH